MEIPTLHPHDVSQRPNSYAMFFGLKIVFVSEELLCNWASKILIFASLAGLDYENKALILECPQCSDPSVMTGDIPISTKTKH